MDRDDFVDAATSLGMSQEEYDKVVNECIFGDDIERKED
jgi:hypothetical protein